MISVANQDAAESGIIASAFVFHFLVFSTV